MAGIACEKEYEIHYYEVDYKKRVLITTIIDYLSDTATYQSEELNVGINYLSNQHMAWVLYKWDIDIKKYPMYREKIVVKTEPYSFRKFYAYRKFEITDTHGQVIVEANSVWLLINTDKRKAVRITEDMYKGYGLDKSENKLLNIKKINSPIRIDAEKYFNVRYSDIDVNKHVNNVKYVNWVIESIPIDLIKDYKLKSIKVAYRKETTYGEKIKVITEINNKEKELICLHEILDSNNKSLTLAETKWVIDKK
ncbi:acyl-ACP thioesterase [Clostridium acetireducens DSM 10703]|uniref:Acyl-ACP thioesterase n=1 Tax=Clostridium acetireducens DSM 10703 TaxID=1121290 RepID=A0A1E8EX68_9CLOT|nr:acyl-ACP thioesterase domain-containing protein [Clostridium acetireducens]OFI05371.1 acyl-ACP thioesterase [Clostridium acetireducens DSM 10703]